MQGVVKAYDPATGFGTVLLDDGVSEILLGPGSLKGGIFRMVRQGQRVVFDTEERDGRTFAVGLRLGSDGS